MRPNHIVLLATVIDPMFRSTAAKRIRFLCSPSGIFSFSTRRLFCISSDICGREISFLIADLSALTACSTILGRKGLNHFLSFVIETNSNMN